MQLHVFRMGRNNGERMAEKAANAVTGPYDVVRV